MKPVVQAAVGQVFLQPQGEASTAAAHTLQLGPSTASLPFIFILYPSTDTEATGSTLWMFFNT